MNMKQLGVRAALGIMISCPCVLATPAAAQVSVGIGISLPPPIVFAAPPQVVVLPGFDIYVAPDIVEEVYFVDGWWWRPWQGRWYRSQSYSSGWGHYADEPYFYRNVRRDWRDDYRNHRWEGQAWNYERIPHQRVEQNWSSWKSSKHWKSQNNWGVPGYKARQQDSNDRPAVAAPQQRRSEAQAPKAKSHAAPPKAAKSQRQSGPSMKSARPPQQRESSPKAVKSQGGGKPQGQKQGSQPKGGGGSKGEDHGSDGKAHSQGGGKGKN